MPRNTPKTFAEARSITDPIRRADALLKLSQEAEDRRAQMRKDAGQLTDEQRRAIQGFLKYWKDDISDFSGWSEFVDACEEALSSGELPDEFDRLFDEAYQGALDEYDNPSPSFKRDPEELATALTNLTNAVHGTAYEPNFRDDENDDDGEKAARPAMRKAGYASRDQIVASMKWGDWDSKGKTRIGTSSLVPGAKFIILKEPIQGYKYQLLVDYNGEKSQIDKNDDPNKLMRHPPAHWIEGNMPDREPDANDAGDQQAYVASARARMRKADSAIIDNFCEDAKSLFNELMADDYFSKAYTPGDLASAALIITYKKSGSDSPTSKKVVRETGNRYL